MTEKKKPALILLTPPLWHCAVGHWVIMEIPSGWGFEMPKFLRESVKLNWNFQQGGKFKPEKNLPWGIWTFPEQHNSSFSQQFTH